MAQLKKSLLYCTVNLARVGIELAESSSGMESGIHTGFFINREGRYDVFMLQFDFSGSSPPHESLGMVGIEEVGCSSEMEAFF